MKIVINNCYGGFSVSDAFCDHYGIPRDTEDSGYNFPRLSRTDKRLIEYIEKFGSEAASGKCANLIVVEIPNGTLYRINEYDGAEYIETRDGIDWQIATENE